MAGVTYKCPSCGAYLVFDPDTQKWRCEFCSADYDEKDLLAKGEAYAREAEQELEASHAEDGSQVVYHCPSCGSEVVTDETTVATQCYYCHSPVVLQGKLTADMKPDLVLPFSVSKDKAVEHFMSWVKKKRFVPKGFFSRSEIDSMTGVYYPHFITDCTLDGVYEGEGRQVSVAVSQRYTTTTTRHFAIRRRGTLHFRDVIRPALKSADRKLSDGIHPFPMQETEPFSSAYLTGFLAERRDLDADSIRADVENELERYVEPMLTGDLNYDSHNGSASASIKSFHSRYVLLPTWVLTYKKGSGEPYYYALNGRTGASCGKLPVDGGKLCGYAAVVGAAVCALLCVLGYFLY